MRRLMCLVVLVAAALVQPAYGQRLLVLMTADLSPAAKWGVYAPNLTMDLLRMRTFFESNAPAERLQLETLYIEENADATPERILDALRRFEPTPQDAVAFYFTGHGGIDDRGSYFDLAGGKLYREQVRGLLTSKQPRLTVLLTDCCNSRSDGRKEIAGAPFNEPPKSYSPLFTTLFVRPTGVVDVNSSAPGQSAFFLPNTDGNFDKFGSIFTTTLTEWAEKNQRRTASWDDLLREVSLKVHATFHAAYPKGAKGAKGNEVQSDQDVFAPEYPGMPNERGLRAGIYVVDNDGQSVRINGWDPNSPAAASYNVKGGTYTAVPVGGVITAINGRGVSNTAAFQQAVTNSPQIMRLTIVRGGITGDYLIRLRY